VSQSRRQDRKRPTRRQYQDGILDAPERRHSLGNTHPIKEAKPLTPRNHRQKTYINQIQTEDLTFGYGAAGTGKTFIAAYMAGDAYDKGEVKRIIVTRPIVEAGESLGFLPGGVDEKIDPYFIPVLEALEKRLGKGQVAYMREKGDLLFCPFAFMRGRTFDDAFIILDEAQNTSVTQMKMFLTRPGDRSKVVVNGDLKQSDIPGVNGLQDAVPRFRNKAAMTFFLNSDVVRSPIAAMAVDAYDGEDLREQSESLGTLPLFITRETETLTHEAETVITH
jgi:phosphate starvation-inducible PhoH-like protein